MKRKLWRLGIDFAWLFPRKNLLTRSASIQCSFSNLCWHNLISSLETVITRHNLFCQLNKEFFSKKHYPSCFFHAFFSQANSYIEVSTKTTKATLKWFFFSKWCWTKGAVSFVFYSTCFSSTMCSFKPHAGKARLLLFTAGCPAMKTVPQT